MLKNFEVWKFIMWMWCVKYAMPRFSMVIRKCKRTKVLIPNFKGIVSSLLVEYFILLIFSVLLTRKRGLWT